MTYQLLVATMKREDGDICKEMNINSDAIIINQSDFCGLSILKKNDNTLKVYSFPELGVGLSRNSALMRSDADIVEFADDDMVFTDTYKYDVLNEFIKHPEADVILFSLESMNSERPLIKIDKFARVRRIEALKYGCARVAARREKLLYKNINFSLLFGGGAVYSSGEDTLFLQDCIKAGLKVYKSPVKVADVKQETSTWFDGFNDKYYRDKGALFAAVFPKMCRVYAFLTALKATKNNGNFKKIYKLFLEGICNFKNCRKG